MGRWLSIVVGFLALVAAPAAVAQPPRSIFNDWTAIVVAGDWRAHSGGPTEAFDNARRDVAATLENLGFPREEIVQFSTRPERDPETRPIRTEAPTMDRALRAGAQRKTGGCLVYYTSHGSPPGVVLDVRGEAGLYRPQALARLVDEACPNRPSIVIVSACFSGVFIPALANDQRLVLTAARPDRASFGCGESDHYPFFDDCFLQSVDTSRNFSTLGAQVQACVARKEREMNLAPASEPQVWVGARLRPILPLWGFPPGARAVRRE